MRMGRRSAGAVVFALLLVVGCSKDAPSQAAGSATSSSPGAAAFDIEGFCDKTMALGKERKCEGDDELMEGNKVGLCSTTLRTARDDKGVKLDQLAAAACIKDVSGASPPLPDRRTLRHIADRFESCRRFASAVVTMPDGGPTKRGAAAAGAACKTTNDCAHGLSCAADRASKRQCAPKKKAGEPCRASSECLGRCSRQQGNKCVSYCGSG